MSNRISSDTNAEYKEITDFARDTMSEAIAFLKDVRDEQTSFSGMLEKLIALASHLGRYRLFFELNRCEEYLFYRCRQDTLLSIEDIKNTIKYRGERLERHKIINAKCKGTILPENACPIRDIGITVNATHNDNWQIKATIYPSQDCVDKKLFSYTVNEMFKVPSMFRLEKYESKEFELSIEQMRIQSHTGDMTGKGNICEFHVEKGTLTTPRNNSTKMVRVNIPNLLGNGQTGGEPNFPLGIIEVEKNTFYKMTAVASVSVVPLEEKEATDKWHYNTRKILHHSLALMRFITAVQSLHISSEEHRYDDRSEYYFEKDIDKFYPILGNRCAKTLLGKVFNASSRDGFVEDISKLAEAAEIANTYSSSWRIRLICMIEAIEVWSTNKKFKLLGEKFYTKLKVLSGKCAGIDNIKELNTVRNNVMHNGKATPTIYKRNKEEFGSQKDESKYYFFKFREILVQVFLSELNWEGEYYAYSCDRNGAVTSTKKERGI